MTLYPSFICMRLLQNNLSWLLNYNNKYHRGVLCLMLSAIHSATLKKEQIQFFFTQRQSMSCRRPMNHPGRTLPLSCLTSPSL